MNRDRLGVVLFLVFCAISVLYLIAGATFLHIVPLILIGGFASFVLGIAAEEALG